MSIKKLFDKNKPSAVLVSTNLEEEVVKNAPELESADNVREQMERINRFIPQVDFSDPSNFARYGSAQQYYEDTISRIVREYPYDGSQEEITRFQNESNYIDKYIFDSKYPRTTGYAIFSANGWGTQSSVADGYGRSSNPEYIEFKGGPHTASGGMPTGKLHQQFTGSNYYDTDIYTTEGTLALGRVGSRESNLKFDWTTGQTVEFWLKKDEFISSLTEKEVLFDLWNGEDSGSVSYGRLTLFLTASSTPLRLNLMSGTTGFANVNLDTGLTDSTLADGSWRHYAISFKNTSGTSALKVYVDGASVSSLESALDIQEVTGSLRARIGALITSPSGSSAVAGAGKLSGSLDEFRYWKSERTEKQIQENYWTQVRGGTNNEIANAELGVYYKFNEGITGQSSTDSVVLDYSGRITNGTWTGYASGARSTGSAINEATSVVAGTVEYRDPIIYDFHPDVQTLKTELEATGSIHDFENQASIMDSIPSWMVDEDENKGNGELKKLTQIVGSYFDTLQLQVERLPHLPDTTYDSASAKPLPFAQRLLTSRGFEAPEIFVDATLLEYFGNRKGDRAYELDLHEVKNLIYQNIYNNLSYIYKSKGTEKAFRNLIRCYGIGDEIVKFNAYGNNTEFKFEDTFYDTTTRKNYVDFNHPDRFGGIVYQSSSAGNANTTDVTYISGTNANFATTTEIEVIFPRKLENSNPQHFNTSFITSSIFGHHVAASDHSDFDFPATAGNDRNFQLYFVRTHKESKDGHFLLKDRAGNFELTSSVYSNVYDNQKWNFAVRIRDQFWPYSNGITGSGDANDGVLEWYGVNMEYGVVKNRFELSTTRLHNGYLSSARRYYVGADRTNSSGSVITNSDVRVSSLRHYLGYLDNSVIDAHARDPENIGTKNPSRNILFGTDTTSTGEVNVYIPEAASLALNWDYAQVTGSDSSGRFTVDDASSGSVSLRDRYPNTTDVSHILANQYAGAGYFPSATSSAGVINKDYIPTAKQRLPEVVNSADAVNVMSRDDELFPRDAAISQTIFAFEKSMYGVISQEMLNMFGTIIDFNNLIGDVVHKYRDGYKGLDKLRNLFFEKVQNDPDLDKFIDFYKWIDQSLAIFLQQLVPASADVTDEIRVMVEDHLLGRSKYQHKYPLLDYKGNQRWGGDEAKLEARVRGIDELTYDWEHGHAPLNEEQSSNALWWKNRAERDNTNFNTSDTIDSARQAINDIILSFNSASAEVFVGSSGNYEGSTYAIRRFTSPLKLDVAVSREIRGGYNFPRNQKPDALYGAIKPDSSRAFTVTVGDAKDIDFSEVEGPIVDVKRNRIDDSIKSTDGPNPNDYSTGKGAILSPVAIYSSSADTAGYRSEIFVDSTEVIGHLFDNYGDDYEVPMQGPFTQEHVGGNRHRHTDLADGTDNQSNRAEAYQLIPGPSALSLRFKASDEAYAFPSTSPQYRRDETAKRPVNIKNIQHTTASAKLGNFSHTYEVVQTSDRNLNNSAFVKAEGFDSASIPSSYVTGVVDYTKPVRGSYKHVIVERFSAPGGSDVAGDNQGGPSLDIEAAQFSPYNNINYRNLTVRQPLQTLLTERSEQFGLRSGSAVSSEDYTSVTASFHKINRNPLQRLETGSAGIVTASTFDNYYIQHMIPRSDYQYAWITASYISSNTNVYGYLPYDGYVSTSAGLIGAINFVSQSALGSGIQGASRRPKDPDDTYNAGSFVSTDFVGLNTTIIEPLSSSAFTQGYPTDADILHYYNYSDIGIVQTATTNDESFIERIGADNPRKAQVLQNLISHRQGPYGHPTWKQIRVGQGQLARYYRKNNFYTHTPDGGNIIDVSVSGGTNQIRQRYAATLTTSQSVVTSKFRPVAHELQVRTGVNKDGSQQITTLVVETSLGNNLVLFDNPEFANTLGLKSNIADTAYKQIKELYTNGGLEDPSSPVYAVNKVTYSEIVYPSIANAHTSKVRGRTNYYNNFWRDSRENRYNSEYDVYRQNNGFGFASNTLDKLSNSMNISLDQSIWVLDADENFATNIETKATGGIDAQNTDGYRSGELQNKYVGFVQRNADAINGTVDKDLFRRGSLYSRKYIYPGNPTPLWQLADKILLDYGVSAGVFSTVSGGVGRGEAQWDAPTLAGNYDGTASTFVTVSANPFYDDYAEYFSDIKTRGADYSIVPEFRISDHLEFYNDRGADFLADNSKFLRIVNTPSGSSTPQNSSEDNFFTVFTNSDFMKYFEVVKEDHEGVVSPASVKLRCRALKKFLPYDGFYPAERTIEMASQLSKSVSPYVELIGTDSGKNAAFNTFMKPFASPGILFNTIKSGIAVDYPIMTGSYQATSVRNDLSPASNHYRVSASFAIFSNSTEQSKNGLPSGILQEGDAVSHNDGWDYRMPFEAIIEPEAYIAGQNIVNDEPSAFAHMDVTASWGGQFANRNYHNMMHNFLAETLDFFVEEGTCTKIVSKPQKEWKPMTPGQPYGMRIKIYRSLEGTRTVSGSWGDFTIPQYVSGSEKTNFVMYSRPSAFGPPVGMVFGSTEPNHTDREFSPRNGVYASHTPPYYDGESWIDVVFYPYASTDTTASLNRDSNDTFTPTIDDIFSQAPFGFAPSGTIVDGEILPEGYPAKLFERDENYGARIGAQGTYIRRWRFDQQALKGQPTYNSYHNTGSNRGPMAGPWANIWAMQGDASLNIFEKDDPNPNLRDEFQRWKIQTKFETPMLNFNHVENSDITTPDTTNTAYNNAVGFVTPRGMWHQFGRIPLENEGVFIQVTDIPDNWMDNNVSSSVINDPLGHFDTRNRLSPAQSGENLLYAEQALSGYRIPKDGAGLKILGETANFGNLVTNKPKSLVDICGFSTEPEKVGRIRNEKVVYEAVVAVPFIEEDGERKFFKVLDPSVKYQGSSVTLSPMGIEQNDLPGQSVRRQIDLMERYVFPPAMDFVHNKTVEPVAMYVFEFSHKFTKDDLSHIWQNLTPKIGTQAETALATVEHPLLVDELLGDPDKAARNALNDFEPYHTGMPEKLQWMVFKVKQRAKRDYFVATGKKETEETPFYTYNWPYDQFSLVELAQVQVDVDLAQTIEKVDKQQPATPADTPASRKKLENVTVEKVSPANAIGFASRTGLPVISSLLSGDDE